ncbi:MAG: hypothetical protein SO013_10380 [Prevotella sp.]|nr:hypothetical protein [Prevotella sp.]
MMNTIKIVNILFSGVLLLTATACDDFVFGKVSVNDEENPLIQKKTPRSGAEIYYGTEPGQKPFPADKNADVANPDPQGAFANWYSCLVMLKEGHPHYGGKMHANHVYSRAAWKQEQFAEVYNTKSGQPRIAMDYNSIRTYVEEQKGNINPEYFRVVGGTSKLWALCLYFYDKEGRLINDNILNHSDEYQIFFSISHLDEHNNPYPVLDVRYREDMPTTGVIEGVPAESFNGKDKAEDRQAMTPKIFNYTYRDTWKHENMGDGVRDFFNIKLLPPLTPNDMYNVTAEDQDCVGLKGHLEFDFTDLSDGLDERQWPLELSGKGFYKKYRRPTYLLPKFCLAVRVLKCAKGKKAVIPTSATTRSKLKCASFYQPDARSEWKEIIRFNLPIKVFCSNYDSDPTNIDPYEPYFYHISREIGLSPEDAYETITSGSGKGGLGFDAWFL